MFSVQFYKDSYTQGHTEILSLMWQGYVVELELITNAFNPYRWCYRISGKGYFVIAPTCLFLPWAPSLTFLNNGLWPGSVSQINPLFSGCFLLECFFSHSNRKETWITYNQKINKWVEFGFNHMKVVYCKWHCSNDIYIYVYIIMA